MKSNALILLIISFIWTTALFAGEPNYTILFSGKYRKKMVIIDLENDKEIDGTRKNLLGLFKNESFQTALRRDVGMDPDVFEKRLLKHKKVGAKTALSEKLFNKMKDDKLYKKREKIRDGINRLRKKKKCAAFVAAIIYAAELNSDIELDDLKSGDINRQIAIDERDELNQSLGSAVNDLQDLNIEKGGCEGNPQESNSEIFPLATIEVYCEKVENKPKEDVAKEANYKKISEELLKERETQRENLSDVNGEKYELKIAFLNNQIKNIRIFLKKDETGCLDPYDGFEDAILFSKKPKEDKCDYSNGLFGVNYGKECYPQRYSCMDKKQKENFEKLKDSFEFQNPEDNAFLIKFPILNNETGEIVRNYSYEKGNQYDVKGVNELSKSYEVKRTGADGKLFKEDQKTPEYFMIDSDGKYSRLSLDDNTSLRSLDFKKAKYPFFRPTDQCSSVPVQGSGGVCFQEACKQHDLCFQTLADTKTTTFDQHFNKCNNVFERNIGRLCDQNKKKGFFGWTKNISCHTGKKVFYAGVQWGEGVILDKGGSFKQSQNDQYEYLNRLYQSIEREYCKGNESKTCLTVDQKLNDLNELKERTR